MILLVMIDNYFLFPLTPGSCRAPCRPATSWPAWRCPPWWSGRCPPWCWWWPGVRGRLLWCYVLCCPAQVCPALSTAQTGQPWILSTFCSQSRHFSGSRRRISVLFVTCIKSNGTLKCVNVDSSPWQPSQFSVSQMGGLFVNIYPGRCHSSSLSLFCYWAPTRLNSKHTEQTDVWADWLTECRDPKRPVPALLV